MYDSLMENRVRQVVFVLEDGSTISLPGHVVSLTTLTTSSQRADVSVLGSIHHEFVTTGPMEMDIRVVATGEMTMYAAGVNPNLGGTNGVGEKVDAERLRRMLDV